MKIPSSIYKTTFILINTICFQEHYNRRPKGLVGALGELGLTFEGREHSGLDDAKNTAKLAARMIADGMLLRITTDITPRFG